MEIPHSTPLYSIPLPLPLPLPLPSVPLVSQGSGILCGLSGGLWMSLDVSGGICGVSLDCQDSVVRIFLDRR